VIKLLDKFRKIGVLVKIRNFRKKSELWSKIRIFVENPNLSQNRFVCEKSTFGQNRNFSQNRTFYQSVTQEPSKVSHF